MGLSYLLPTLTETGHLDIAYRLLNNDTFPSWGYSIKHGATTIWERWDGWTADKGFQDPGMNSFNHYAFGSVGRWLFGTVAGIDTPVLSNESKNGGYKRIIIKPQIGGGLTYARASYNSCYGVIASDWRLGDGTFILNVIIPANTTATVFLPTKDVRTVTESGLSVAKATGLRLLRVEEQFAVFTIGSGRYQFISVLP